MLIHWQENHAYLVLGIFLACTVMFIPGMMQTETIVALENMMPPTTESVETANMLRNQGLPFDSFAIKLRVGTSNKQTQPQTIQGITMYIERLSKDLLEIHGVTNVLTPLENPSFIDESKRTGVITLQGYQGDDGEEIARIFEEIQDELLVRQPRGVETTIVGVPAVQQELSTIVNKDTVNTGVLSIILVFLITLAIFKGSLTAATMPILIVLFSVVWLYGTIGYLGIPLSTLAGSVAALVIGIGVDYSIHILNTYKHFRKKTGIRESLDKAVQETGLAILFTSITTISAFLSFIAGSMPEMTRFGVIMSLGIFYALLLSFVLLPALFVIEDDIMVYVKGRVEERR